MKKWLAKKTWQEVLILSLAAVVVGLVSNAISPRGVQIALRRPVAESGDDLAPQNLVSLPRITVPTSQADSLSVQLGQRRTESAADWDEPVVFNIEQVRSLMASDSAILIDARPVKQYRTGHLPGAVSIPCDEFWDHTEVLKKLPMNKWVIVYCEDQACDAAERLADELIAFGFRRVANFTGGIKDWQDAGHNVERGSGSAVLKSYQRTE